MNLIIDNIERIMKIVKQLEKKEISKNDAEIIISAAREARKWATLAIQAYAVESKNKRVISALERMNIMDGSTAVDLMLGDPEADKVKCPCYNDLITRAECLDYSGNHYDDCKGCKIGLATKNKLLGE